MKHSYERKLNYVLEQFPYEICCEISFLHLRSNSCLKLTSNFFYKYNWIFMKINFLKSLLNLSDEWNMWYFVLFGPSINFQWGSYSARWNWSVFDGWSDPQVWFKLSAYWTFRDVESEYQEERNQAWRLIVHCGWDALVVCVVCPILYVLDRFWLWIYDHYFESNN